LRPALVALAGLFTIAAIVVAVDALDRPGSEPAPTTSVASQPPASSTPVPQPTLQPTPRLTTPETLPMQRPIHGPLIGREPGPPSAILDETGWPRGAVGPLVIYAREDQYIEIVTFDLGARREVALFRAPRVLRPQFKIAGSAILVRFSDSLWSYGFDGSGGRELLKVPEGHSLERFVPNPAGSLVAVNHRDGIGFDRENVLKLIEVESGDVLLDLVQSTIFEADEYVGVAGPDRWNEGGTLMSLRGFTYSESPGGSGTLSVDGDVTS
jgi:hypothetical protein